MQPNLSAVVPLHTYIHTYRHVCVFVCSLVPKFARSAACVRRCVAICRRHQQQQHRPRCTAYRLCVLIFHKFIEFAGRQKHCTQTASKGNKQQILSFRFPNIANSLTSEEATRCMPYTPSRILVDVFIDFVSVIASLNVVVGAFEGAN